MNNTLRPGDYLGIRGIERRGGSFTAALRRATVPPQQVHEHHHEGAHVILAIDGAYRSRACPGEDASAMTLVYNPPGTVHRDCFAAAGGRFMSVDLDPELVPAQLSAPVVIRDPGARFSAGRMAGLISAEGAADELEDLLLALLAPIGRDAQRSTQVPRWLTAAAEAAGDLAADHETTISGIARAVGVHPVHFARMHRRHFGCTPGEAIRRHRVMRATALLGRGARLAEVALDAGFADQSHMTRAFRHEFGTTPARYRAAFG